jgi:hypothetical protein
MFIQGLVLGELVALQFRRKKWHQEEYDKIAGSLDKLQPSQIAAAHFAMLQHKVAITELEACIARKEPSWGPERHVEPAPEETVPIGLA